MKCKYCGGEIDNDTKKCPFCGSAISLEDQKELEQLNKAGCPKCHSTNIAFTREKAGTVKNKKGNSTVLYQTKGVCNDCGHTWTTDAPKKSKVWLWVLGWIFIFPLPLTILLLRKKDMKPGLKYGIIGGAWAIFLLFVVIYNAGKNTTPSSEPAQPTAAVVAADGNIQKIESLETDIQIDLSSSYKDHKNSWFNITAKDKDALSYEDVVLVSEDPSIATIEYDQTALGTYIYYNVYGVSAGTTYIYCQSKDGSVVSPKVPVTVTGEKPTPTPTKAPTPTPDPDAPPPETTERQVWITDGGSKYHRTSTCSGMEDAYKVPISEAEDRGYEPCGKCY